MHTYGTGHADYQKHPALHCTRWHWVCSCLSIQIAAAVRDANHGTGMPQRTAKRVVPSCHDWHCRLTGSLMPSGSWQMRHMAAGDFGGRSPISIC